MLAPCGRHNRFPSNLIYPNALLAEEEPSLWEARHGSSALSAAQSSLLSSPGRDNNEEKSLRDNALKSMGKASQNQQRLQLDVALKTKDEFEPSTPLTPGNVKEIMDEQMRDKVDPRHRMLLKNEIQHRGNRR